MTHDLPGPTAALASPPVEPVELELDLSRQDSSGHTENKLNLLFVAGEKNRVSFSCRHIPFPATIGSPPASSLRGIQSRDARTETNGCQFYSASTPTYLKPSSIDLSDGFPPFPDQPFFLFPVVHLHPVRVTSLSALIAHLSSNPSRSVTISFL